MCLHDSILKKKTSQLNGFSVKGVLICQAIYKNWKIKWIGPIWYTYHLSIKMQSIQSVFVKSTAAYKNIRGMAVVVRNNERWLHLCRLFCSILMMHYWITCGKMPLSNFMIHSISCGYSLQSPIDNTFYTVSFQWRPLCKLLMTFTNTNECNKSLIFQSHWCTHEY